MRFIIEALDVDDNKVCYATFTGKAAQVLLKKGNKNALTLHKLLYDSIPRPAGGFIRIPKKSLDYEIVVVDEVSMAPKSIMDLLFKHNVYVICLGDPFQLPPIDKDEDNHLLDKPHIFLDEIMRQAAESEIIRLTMDIRAGKPLECMKGDQVHIFNKKDLVDGMYTWADQILVATNDTRHSINDQIRQMRGFGPDPQEGDKIICLRNYWQTYADYGAGDPLVNGTIGTLYTPYKNKIYVPRYAYKPGVIQALNGNFISSDGSDYGELIMDPDIITSGESALEWRDKYKLGKLVDRIGDVIPKEFAYGYAITCHKAQGSEWDKVLVIEEDFPRVKEEHARWLYTACTRSVQKLTLIRH